MHPSLETLPLLPLELICEYLNYDSCGCDSLFAFSLVSRRCYAAATRELFKHIQIIIRNEDDVIGNLSRLKEDLGDGRLRYVRYITVKWRRSHFDDEGDIDIAKEGEIYEKPLAAIEVFGRLIEGPYPTSEEKRRQSEKFLPLADFICQLPGLRGLTWAALDQIPSTVLAAVERQHIRLYDYTFSLRSLIQPREISRDIDMDELALATSPSLCSITAPHAHFNAEGHLNRNPDAVMQMVAGLAPNLRTVTLFVVSPGIPLHLLHLVRLPTPPWQGLYKDLNTKERQTTTIGKLTKLSFGGELKVTSRMLEKWSNHTDFSLLQVLELVAGVGGLQTLYKMAIGKTFTSLRGLSLEVISWIYGEEDDINSVTAEFLSALYPLESLRLRHYVAKGSLYTLLDIHGPALRKLQFMPHRSAHSEVTLYSFSVDDLHKLSLHCPNLEEVELLLDRTQGNAKEVQLYRALGMIRKLKRISLALDCSVRSGFNANNDEDVERQEMAHMRNCLINAAIDSTLAVSIFEIISSGNSTLQILKLFVENFVTNGQETPTSEYLYIFKWIGRSWLCHRDPSNARNITTRELKKEARIEHGIRIPERLYSYLPWPFAQVWSELWPEVGVNWKDEWRSPPLATL